MTDGPVTPYGPRWEWWHSLWIGWAVFFVGLFSWASFLYAGLRANKPAWLVWAAVYAFPWVPLVIASEDSAGFGLFDLGMTSLLLVWVTSSVHAFLIRGNYLRRIAERRIARRGPLTARAEAATTSRPVTQPPADWYPEPSDGGGQRWWDGTAWTAHTRGTEPQRSTIYSPSATTSSSPANPALASPAADDRRVLDLNHAQEAELAGLPGIGEVLAKRIVAERHQRGGFQSVEELADAIGLKPHVLQRVRGNLTVGQRPETRPERPRGRVVDF